MTPGFDLAESLGRGVASRSGAWSFIRDFAAHWASPLESGDGWTEADLAAAERGLGVRLPPTMREAYLLFGRRRDLTGDHDVLLGPAELYVDDTEEALVFRHENQGAASWGVLLDDLQDEDPAVHLRLDLADKTDERWDGWLERLSLCFVEIVMSESVQADSELCDYLEPDDDSVRLVEELCVQLPFPAYPTSRQGSGPRWFLGQDVLLRDDGGAGIYVRGRSEADLDRIRDSIPGYWLNDYR
ncbi:hypothetical protein ACWEQG_11755 [Microbispora sp. NPDC004025]